MRTESFDNGARERRILAGLIFDQRVVAKLASRWNADKWKFGNQESNLIAKWAIDHFLRYDEALEVGIKAVAVEWAEEQDSEKSEPLSRLLGAVLDDHERRGLGNPDALTNDAATHLNGLALDRVLESAASQRKAGQLDRARKELTEFAWMDVGVSEGTNLFVDEAEIRSTFIWDSKPIFEYDGNLGRFTQGAFEKDSFIAFMAPNKSRKSFWLMDLAYRCVRKRKRTAYIVVGDMSGRQAKRRILSRVAHRPYLSLTGTWPFDARMPNRLRLPLADKQPAQVDFSPRRFDAPLDADAAVAACKKLTMEVKNKECFFWMTTRPARSVSVLDIENIVRSLALQKWAPEVVIIDYADNLAPLNTRIDKRDQINDTWIALSALRQRLCCMLVTATQADADSFTRWLLTRNNFSDDRRKLDHVTAMFCINMTPAERELGLCRINCIAMREGEFIETDYCHVASCLPLGNPCVLSLWPKCGDTEAIKKKRRKPSNS